MAARVDYLYWTISFLTIFFTVLVLVLVFAFIAKYKRGKVANRKNPVNDHAGLEMTWTLTPILLSLAMFGWGTWVYLQIKTPPKNTIDVFSIGKQWMWHFQHLDGIREQNELHVPVGQPVRITVISQDVVHALYIPGMRVQTQVIPGRYTTLWFEPTRLGKYHMFCTMYCGLQHSEMGGTVYVMTKEDFAKWQANGGNRFAEHPKTMVEQGKQIWDDVRCGSCHGDRDTPQAPSLVGIAGSERSLDTGEKVVADDAYLRKATIDPYGDLVKGYRNTMPVYQGQLSEEQILALNAYIKSLTVTSKEPAKPRAITEPEVNSAQPFDSGRAARESTNQ